MSLINEALKKARTSQPVTAATSMAEGPALRPLDPNPRARVVLPMTLLVVIAAVLALACVLLWMWYRAGREELQVRAKTSAASTVNAAPKVAMPVASPTTAPSAAATPAPAAATTPDAAPANGDAAAVSTEANASTAPVHTYKLEGIFYSPKKSSAVIDGELVYVGSEVADGRVVAIDEESATVVTTAGQTNLLVLTR